MSIAKPTKEPEYVISTLLNGRNGPPSHPQRFSKSFDFALEATWQ